MDNAGGDKNNVFRTHVDESRTMRANAVLKHVQLVLASLLLALL